MRRKDMLKILVKDIINVLLLKLLISNRIVFNKDLLLISYDN